MTEREVRIINGKEVALYRHKELDSYLFAEDAVDLLLKAFEEVEQYRAIGTVERFRFLKEVCDLNGDELENIANSMIELKNYRKIGTVEEFKDLKEKNEPKKVAYQGEHEKCPICGSFNVFGNYCTECGQKLDWGKGEKQ